MFWFRSAVRGLIYFVHSKERTKQENNIYIWGAEGNLEMSCFWKEQLREEIAQRRVGPETHAHPKVLEFANETTKIIRFGPLCSVPVCA